MDWMDIWTHLGYVQALCSAINATTQYNIWRNVPISLQDPRWRLQHLLFQTRDWSSQGVGIWGAVLSPRYFHLHQKQAFGVGILWLIWMCLVMEYIFKPRLGYLKKLVLWPGFKEGKGKHSRCRCLRGERGICHRWNIQDLLMLVLLINSMDRYH